MGSSVTRWDTERLRKKCLLHLWFLEQEAWIAIQDHMRKPRVSGGGRQEPGEKLRLDPLLGFLWERQGRTVKPFRTAEFE